MTDNDLLALSERTRNRAMDVIRRTDVIGIWRRAGAEANIVGSLAMDLMMTHRDIDLHVYSSPLTVNESFAAMARLAENTSIGKIE